MKEPFLDKLREEIERCSTRVIFGNHDHLRFPISPWNRFKENVVLALKKAGLDQRKENWEPKFQKLKEEAEEWEWLYRTLADEQSKQVLLQILSYRVLGPRRVRFSALADRWPEVVASMKKHQINETKAEEGSGPLSRRGLFRWKGRDGEIRLKSHPLNWINTLYLEQYATDTPDGRIEVQPGQTVIDGGGCWGDTALYFADRAGKAGKVHSFEFSPANLETFRRNLNLNPQLSGRIQIHPFALSNQSGQTVTFEEGGPGTTLKGKLGKNRATTKSIDALAEDLKICPIGFIKLDIEGFELPTLRGAAQTILRDQPALAIAAYHKPDDLFKIPREILKINQNYKIYMRHFTIHNEETMVLAK